VSRKRLLTAAVAAVVMLGMVGSAYPEQRYIRLEGHVQFIAGQTMILVTSTDEMDSYIPRTLWSVRVDLREVPLDEYNTLTQGDFCHRDRSPLRQRLARWHIHRPSPLEAE